MNSESMVSLRLGHSQEKVRREQACPGLQSELVLQERTGVVESELLYGYPSHVNVRRAQVWPKGQSELVLHDPASGEESILPFELPYEGDTGDCAGSFEMDAHCPSLHHSP